MDPITIITNLVVRLVPLAIDLAMAAKSKDKERHALALEAIETAKAEARRELEALGLGHADAMKAAKDVGDGRFPGEPPKV